MTKKTPIGFQAIQGMGHIPKVSPARKKKVAVAKSLAATIHGVRVATSGSLVERAREKASEYRSRRRTWFDDFADRDPVAAKELCELVADWHAFGKTRSALPTRAAVYRFAVDEIGVPIQQNQFAIWMNSRRGA